MHFYYSVGTFYILFGLLSDSRFLIRGSTITNFCVCVCVIVVVVVAAFSPALNGFC